MDWSCLLQEKTTTYGWWSTSVFAGDDPGLVGASHQGTTILHLVPAWTVWWQGSPMQPIYARIFSQ